MFFYILLCFRTILQKLCQPEEETEIKKPLLHGCVCFHVAAVSAICIQLNYQANTVFELLHLTLDLKIIASTRIFYHVFHNNVSHQDPMLPGVPHGQSYYASKVKPYQSAYMNFHIPYIPDLLFPLFP